MSRRTLANRLRAFVPPPAEATLDAEDELPQSVDIPRHAWLRKDETPTFDRVELVRRDMESAASRDLHAVLRLVDRGRVAVSAKTRRASATAVQRIAEVVDGGDFFDPMEKKERWEQTIGPIRAFAWPWLLQAGKLVECRGSKLALTKAGHAALGAPAAPALRSLWQRWIRSTLLDEFSRIDDIKGQHRGKGRRTMTTPSGRRPVIAEALAQCPVGRWVRFDDFSRYMRASSFDFDITRDPWLLYLADAHYGSLGYEGGHHWDILQGRYLPLSPVRIRRHPGHDRRRLHRPGRGADGFRRSVGDGRDGVAQPVRRPAVLPAESARRVLPGARRAIRAEHAAEPRIADRVSRPAAVREHAVIARREAGSGDLGERRVGRRLAPGS